MFTQKDIDNIELTYNKCYYIGKYNSSTTSFMGVQDKR